MFRFHCAVIGLLLAGLLLAGLLLALPAAAAPQTPADFAASLAALSPTVLSPQLRQQFDNQAWRYVRARGDLVNQVDVASWRAIKTRADWEAYREDKLRRLRDALGSFPEPPRDLDVRVTNTIQGDGYVVENLVFQSRPEVWVTANLYSPPSQQRPAPGILIAHSHHRPKTQGELQDMGMTWARKGCVVLVIDQLGHGERADHPFQSKQDYRRADESFRWWRQDYYYRFDTNVQLSLVGESLMGWLVWDLMRGVDLLLDRPGIDLHKIIILGAVAGGGDPAAVTAALDRRIAAAVPFNFGGPQPETRYPLPADADLRFNYLGGAHWESTRNLRKSGVDGFLHWMIVGSIAPRHLIYAHEFAWDKDRDPVWQRLEKLYEFYGATDRLDYTLGRGSVKGRPPESTHCTNIGSHHRQRIHSAFRKWFDIDVSPEDEYSQHLDESLLQSMTGEARRELRPRKLHQILQEVGETHVQAARDSLSSLPPARRRAQLRQEWSKLLGDIRPRGAQQILAQGKEDLPNTNVAVERIVLETHHGDTEPGILVPMILLYPRARNGPTRMVIAVAQSGKQKFLRERADEIAELLHAGMAVCLPDLRGAGLSRGSRGDGPDGSTSYYALFFETPMLGFRLRDLRAVFTYLRTRADLGLEGFVVWGDSFTPPNSRETDFQVPKRVSGRPRFSEPVGGLLALLAALYEPDVQSVYTHGGLGSYQDVLHSPYVYIPHDVVIPGLLGAGDLADLAGALAPIRLQIDGVVDGLNRELSEQAAVATYQTAIEAYQLVPDSLAITAGKGDAASWFLQPPK